MSRTRSYLRYWGKASPERDGQSAPCHLLPYHSLDVAAVGKMLLDKDDGLTRRLSHQLSIGKNELHNLVVFSLALHDIGKFARSFQGLAQPMGCNLVPPAGLSYIEKHDALGARAWNKQLLSSLPGLRENGGDPEDLDTEDALDLWMGCFFGHHGKPVRGGAAPLEASFRYEDLTALVAFASDAETLLTPDWPHAHLKDEQWRLQTLAHATWLLAGLAIVTDWLGSNAHFFRYISHPMPLADYWHDFALPNAERALAVSGLVERPTPVAFRGFRNAFGFAPTPLQTWAEGIPLSGGPELFILEDVTGSGKTEAALTLAHRLLTASKHDGLYFGLPTMATSNAMYRRIGNYYRQLYSQEAHPSLVLAHGARHLEETFAAAIVPPPNADRPYHTNDESAGIECRSWLADNRKKALLADVGVGTIDQALLGVLPRKHQPVRLLGLANKVLVVDEVHAYDTYTTTLLQILLENHARQGGSAILLSATLPNGLRRSLTSAWARGRGELDGQTTCQTEFPLVTYFHDQGLQEIPISPRWGNGHRLPVGFLHDPNHALEAMVAAARSGQCACWIRNTVDDAIDAYLQLCARLDDSGRVQLFHARFTMADRQRIENDALQCFGPASGAEERRGRVLIATQVVEQSLDLDFDVLVSDLAPVDLLIQRAGRLRRHVRGAAGDRITDESASDQRPDPTFQIVSPEWTDDPPPDWVRRILPGTSYVYPSPAQLWHTCRVLREEGSIQLPDRARHLIESVHGEGATVPDGLLNAETENHAARQVAASGARFNALRLDQGYILNADGAGWDDDQEIGTRLTNERTVRVALVQEVEGELRPRHNTGENPWAMSTLNLRESQARQLPDLPDQLIAQAEALRDAHPILRYLQLWLAEEDATPGYNATLGAVISRKGDTP